MRVCSLGGGWVAEIGVMPTCKGWTASMCTQTHTQVPVDKCTHSLVQL